MEEIREPYLDGDIGLGQDKAICKSNTVAILAAAERFPWACGPCGGVDVTGNTQDI